MKTILVTGAAGFIGSHVCEKLLSLNYKVIGVDNFDDFYSKKNKLDNISFLIKQAEFTFFELDILNINEIKNSPIDAIIHLAAKAGVRPSLLNPEKYIQTNILGTQIMLDYAKNKNIKKFVFASSSSVYGNNPTPFVETNSVDNPISVYAYTKKCGELMLSTYKHLHDIDYIALRFFTVFGPRQRPDLAINKFISLIQNNKPIEIYGDGNTSRDYTYIDDIVDGIIKSLNYLEKNTNVSEIINLGNNNPIKLIDLVNLIYESIKVKPNFVYLPMQEGDVDATYADIEKAKKILQYTPKIKMREGIILYLDLLKK